MAIYAIFNSTLLLGSIVLCALPFLVHRISTFLFFHSARSHSTCKTPPTAPYSIPGIFHGASILFQGSPTFFTNIIKNYGNFSPFLVKAGPISYLVVRDPQHINTLLNSDSMVPQGLHVQMFDEVMGSPKHAIQRGLIQASRKKDDNLEYAHSVLPRKYLSGTHLDSLLERYTSILSRNLSDKMFQEKTWTEIEDLWTFFRNEVTRAIVEIIFGSTLLKSYPRLVRDFWEFDSNIDDLKRKLPRFMIPKAYLTRDQLVEHMEKWLQSSNSDNNSEQGNADGSDGDGCKASELFWARDQTLAKVGWVTYRARAAEALALLQRTNSEVVPSALWHILETLRDAALMKRLSTEIAACCKPSHGQYNIVQLTSAPVFRAMNAEVARLRTASCAIRRNEGANFKLDNEWLVPKGTSVIIFSHDLALNKGTWSRRWPQMEEPLDCFAPGRFLAAGRPQKERRKGGQTHTGQFNTEGIDDLLVAFGAGSHVCPGRQFARAVQAATLAVLLGEYEIQFSDPDSAEQLMPPAGGVAYGTIKPSGQIRMRLRKRPPP